MTRHGMMWVGGFSVLASLACAAGPDCGDGTEEVDGECVAERDESDADADSDTDADSDADSDSDTDADTSQSPSILSFSTNVTRLTEGESVSFSVVVTDPQGIDDLIGGQLVDPDGGTYGSFATSAGEGAYSLTLSWSQIDQVRTVEFADEEARSFRAEFFDASGHTTRESLEITLHCGEDEGACDGDCVDLSYNWRTCGSCDRACDGDSEYCVDGTCVFESECEPDVEMTCDEVCAAVGATCFDFYDPVMWTNPVGWAARWSGPICSSYVNENFEITRCDQRFSALASGIESAYCSCGY